MKRFFTTLSLLIITTSLTFAQYKPFPQHVKYTEGTIKPSKFTQAQLDSITFTFYEMWKNKYLKNDCNEDQYYVYFDSDKTISVSEGIGYGMLITALMAGQDPLAKFYFDGLYGYYKSYPSEFNPNLMAWEQVEGCKNNPDGGNNSASDGDIDIAYGLLLAYNQWGEKCSQKYDEAGVNVINAIMQDEINPVTKTILMGDWAGRFEEVWKNSTRFSDFIVDHFRTFHAFSKDDKWNQVIDTCYSLINKMNTTVSKNTGLMPDFLVDVNTDAKPAAKGFLESDYDGEYYYNSCRYPWRIATDYLLYGEPKAKEALLKVNDYIVKQTNMDAWKTPSGMYIGSGEPLPGATEYSTTSFIAPFVVSAMVDAKYQEWLDASFDVLINHKFKWSGYYENTIKMLALITISGNYWKPEVQEKN